MSESPSYTIVYDGFCNVCKRLIDVLDKWDRAGVLEFVPSQQPDLAARFPWIPTGAYAESLQLIRSADGKTWNGAAALEQVLDILPKGKFLGWVFSIPFARPLAEKFYRWFARNRYRLGCAAHCKQPTARMEP
jgi:predicted DCC family thiol-disulfide oxidoreductase YuxK